MHYKFLKKIINALGYKLVDKNLVKNDRLLSKYSHVTIDNILSKLFTYNKINSVIQIGSNDGKRFDNLNNFIKKFKPIGILVEPIKSNFENLKKNYLNQENIFFENLAISVDGKIDHLFKVKEDKLHLYDEHIVGITSFKKEHLIRHGVKNKHIVKEIVNAISINDLLKKYKLEKLDLLYIDTEGYDGEIVIDFINNSDLRSIIIFEYIHVNNLTLNSALNQLIKKNYLFFKIEENVICFPNEKKDDLKFI